MKFVLYIDYKANNEKKYEYTAMDAKNLADAILEAERLYEKDKEAEKIYLARIMQKVGKTENRDGCKVETYEAKLCKRSNRWYENTNANSENEHFVERFISKYGEWFECL